MEEVYPVLLQDGIQLSIGPLTNIFRISLALGHISEARKIAKAVFISKTGRPNRVCLKDYRPISLTSFVLKAMERASTGGRFLPGETLKIV